MEGIGVFVFQAALALFAFFVAAPCLLNAISTFGVQKRFAQDMVDRGVVKAEEVRDMQPKKQFAGILVSVIVLAALAYSCIRTAPMGYVCGGVPLIAGTVKYRKILKLNSLTVRRFRNTYKDCMDNDKYNAYVSENF